MPPRGVKKGTKRAHQYENEAKKLDIEGRSNMNKRQLQRAVDAKKS